MLKAPRAKTKRAGLLWPAALVALIGCGSDSSGPNPEDYKGLPLTPWQIKGTQSGRLAARRSGSPRHGCVATGIPGVRIYITGWKSRQSRAFVRAIHSKVEHPTQQTPASGDTELA